MGNENHRFAVSKYPEPGIARREKAADPFRPLEFAGCLALVGVVLMLVAVGLTTAVELYARTLP